MTTSSRDRGTVAAAILAAGASKRLGRPKQLLPYRGRTLIRHAAEAALASPCRPVLVVLGSAAERVRPELEPLAVRPVHNPDWREGMSSSIRAAVRALRDAQTPVAALVFLTCDQPAIDGAVIERLCEAWRSTGKPMVASAYAGTLGVPALFDAALFPELESLRGAAGAKRLLARAGDRVASVDWPQGAEDVDTLADYRARRDDTADS